MKKLLLLILLSSSCKFVNAQYTILSQREQARIIDELLEDRIRTILPNLMRREGIDMWLIISQEHNEDAVIKTFYPTRLHSAKGTTILIFFDPGPSKELDCIAITENDVGKNFKRTWDPTNQSDQWALLARIIEDKNPKKIGINKSGYINLADGLSASNHEKLYRIINKRFADHIVSAEKLAVGWLETRSEREMTLYAQVCRLAHNIIKEGLSEKVIQAGITTTADVEWWFLEKIKELKLDTWMRPTISIQRNEPELTFSKQPQPLLILPGDLIHIDLGISYLRLNTNAGQYAYVLKPGETGAPEYLKKALIRGNKLQDIVTKNFVAEKTGNLILEESLKQGTDQGLTPSVYSHAIGFHGNGAGTIIGAQNMQHGVPYAGEYPLHYKTAYSIELSVTVFIIEWKKEIHIELDEDGYFDEAGFRFIDGRQTDLIIIP